MSTTRFDLKSDLKHFENENCFVIKQRVPCVFYVSMAVAERSEIKKLYCTSVGTRSSQLICDMELILMRERSGIELG